MKQYVSYFDDDETGRIVKGFFEVLEDKPEYIRILTDEGRKIKIPTHRLLKQKDKK